MDFSVFASIALTAAAVIVAGVGIVVAVAAVFGYKFILEEAVNNAVKESLRKVEDEMAEDGIIRKRMIERLDELMLDDPALRLADEDDHPAGENRA